MTLQELNNKFDIHPLLFMNTSTGFTFQNMKDCYDESLKWCYDKEN